MASLRSAGTGPINIWEEHKDVIRQLYLVDRRTLGEVKHIMEAEHGFPSLTLAQYEIKLRDTFKFRKNLKAKDWVSVGQRIRSRERLGLKSDVFFNGVLVSPSKWRKEIARNLSATRRLDERGELDRGSEILPLPDGVVIETPSPEASNEAISHTGFPRHEPSPFASVPGIDIAVPATPQFDIVFIHGLPGHRVRTSVNKDGSCTGSRPTDDVNSGRPESEMERYEEEAASHPAMFWLNNLLPATVPKARILTYRYDPQILSIAKLQKVHSIIDEIALDFLIALHNARRAAPSRPLVLIAHDLGGNITKQILWRSGTCQFGQENLRDVFFSTLGIIFLEPNNKLGDPQDFSSLINHDKTFSFVDDASDPWNHQGQRSDDPFMIIARTQNWIIYAFQKIIPAGQKRIAVDEPFRLDTPGKEISWYKEQNSRDVCRLTDHSDADYQEVSAAVIKILDAPRRTIAGNSEPLLLSDIKRERLLQLLKFEEIDRRRLAIQNAPDATWSWVLRTREFIDWLEPSKVRETNRLLCIKGKPGAGKSVLMKALHAHARKTMKDGIVVSFFFNARGGEMEKSAVGLYRSLLFQLFEQIPTLHRAMEFEPSTTRAIEPSHWSGVMDFEPSTPRAIEQSHWSKAMLEKIFEQAVRHCSPRSVYIYIDALDEAHDDQNRDIFSFLEGLGDLGMNGSSNRYCCISSRHWPYISPHRGLELVLEYQQGHFESIEWYVDTKLRIGQSTRTKDISRQILQRSSGVFLWVVSVLRILNMDYDRGRTFALQRDLDQLPGRLRDLLRNVQPRGILTDEITEICNVWVLFALRSLHPKELYFAIFSEVDPAAINDRDHHQVTDSAIERFILSSSRGLMEVTKSPQPGVSFIHVTVREYLISEYELLKESSGLNQNFIGTSHQRLARCCWRYITQVLCDPRIQESTTKMFFDGCGPVKAAFPFLEYSSNNLLFHMDEAARYRIDTEPSIMSFPLQTWIKIHNLVSDNKEYPVESSFFYVLASCNAANIIQILLEAGADPNAKQRPRGTALSVAVEGGHKDAVQILLEAGAEPYSRDMNGKLVLSIAAEKGHVDIVQASIGAGAGSSVIDRRDRTASSSSAEEGHGDANT